jgi:hypothetical protein
VTWFRRRFADVTHLELWGYGVWLTMGAVIAIPEIWAALDDYAPWPTISGTVGHLEYRWPVIALIVVALIVFGVFHGIRFPVTQDAALARQADGRELRRTPTGRLTLQADPEGVSWLWLVASAVVVVVASFAAPRIWPHNRFLVGYVLYGLIAVLWVILPSCLAYWAGKDVAFPTLFRTAYDLERRLRILAVALLALLVALLIHLALYPWPAIIPDLQRLHSDHPPTPHSI